MRLAIFCHKFGNIGHPFMLEGLKNIISENTDIEVTLIEQHNPLAHFGFNKGTYEFKRIPHNRLRFLKLIIGSNFGDFVFKIILPFLPRFDLVITAGGPSLVPNINNNFEQYFLYNTIYRNFIKRCEKSIDLSLGSALPLDSYYSEKDMMIWKKLLSPFDCISCRDEISFNFVNKIHPKTELIGCPATNAFNNFTFKKEKVFLLNYMSNGANEKFDRCFDPKQFLDEIKKVISFLRSQDYRIKIIAHSRKELEEAKRNFNEDIFFTENIHEYAEFVKDVSMAIASRLHCAIPLSGKNIPVLLLGHDSRMETFSFLGGHYIDASIFNFEEKFMTFYENVKFNNLLYNKNLTEIKSKYKKLIYEI